MKHIYQAFLAIVLSLLAGLISHGRAEAADGPAAVVDELWRGILSSSSLAEESQRERFIRDSLKAHYDFQAFYETALQDHWSSWTDGQKTEFASKFENIFLQSLVGKLKRVPRTGVSLVSEGTTGAGDRVTVSFVGKKGEKKARFKVFFVRRGTEWKIYDVEVEGVLLSRNYRGQFNRILRNEGYSDLIARFDKKISETGGHL